MQQIEIFDIPSPCKGICLVNNRGYCKGCYRSRDERFSWNSLTNSQKKKVLSLCQQRYKRYLQQKIKWHNHHRKQINKVLIFKSVGCILT